MLMTKELYEQIIEAGETLCGYCENDECDKCIITMLIDDATREAVDDGIIDSD